LYAYNIRQSELLYDWLFTANHFVLATSPLRPTTSIFFDWILAVIILRKIRSDGRMCLSFTTAAGSRQRSHSQVQFPRDSWPYFTVSDSRFRQTGGPDPCIYIPQEQGGPVPKISESYVTTGGRSVSQSVYLGIKHQIFITVGQLRVCWCGGRFLWLEDGSVIYNCCWPRQRRHSRVRVPRDSRSYFTVSDSRLPFSLLPTTRRITVEVFDPASTRDLQYVWGYTISWVGSLTEEKSRVFNEISSTAFLVPTLCWEYNLVTF
jgi:hypothetical protein